MPNMQSPDGAETLAFPDAAVESMTALGWSIVGSRHTAAPPSDAPAESSGEPAKRGPGRPRKTRE